MSASIIEGDCVAAMARLPEALVDAVVTDAPYHLQSISKRFANSPRSEKTERYAAGPFGRHAAGFMGKVWDGGDVAMSPDTWRAVLRVLKPGGHLVCFGGTRTHHRVWCAIEDAGFEIRDTLMWVYGSGFPKSHDAGAGWGTALKPAWEPIILARKPLIGTVAENVVQFRTGALNVEACRIPGEGGRAREGEESQERRYTERGSTNFAATPGPRGGDPAGRWPANLLHDGSDEVVDLFPAAPGQQGYVGPEHGERLSKGIFGDFGPRPPCPPRAESSKSAARFFYCAKASRKERDEGCSDLPDAPEGIRSETSGQHITRRDGGDPKMVKNNHPTVKPLALMQWLCRLVTPANGLVLDPFMGSGSTGKAALAEGFNFLGIEKESSYVEIARRRIGGNMTVYKLTPDKGASDVPLPRNPL